MLHLLGMTQSQLQRRCRAGRKADDVDLVDVERVEQSSERVGLNGWCRVRRHRRPEITESRRSDDATIVKEVADGKETPDAVVVNPVDHEQWSAGAALSLWASRYVTTLLYGLQPRDPMTFIGAAAVLMAIGLLAGWIPARRAARIDPTVVLRQ